MKNRTYGVCYAGILYCFVCLLGIQNSSASIRGLWITRFDYKSATDVIKIMENAAFLGASQVYFQVRGNATVYYPSKIEPWAWELTGDSPETLGKDPGWDPLAVALEEATKRKLELHAWLNVFPGWRGINPVPKGVRQPWVTHRSWFMIDHKGVLLRPSPAFYSFLSPGHPQVRSYLASVFGEVAKNYPNLAGIHMDYVRYPGRTEVGGFRDFSFDDESVKAFKKIYKKIPQYTQLEWQQFKCTQVTATIRAIREAIHAASPTMQLSATCFANIRAATEEKGQDPRDWLKDNLVDYVFPMVYERKTADFASRLNAWNASFEDSWMDRMVIGLNVDFNNEREILSQMDFTQKLPNAGTALFAYTSLFPKHLANKKADAIRAVWNEQMLRDLLRKSIPQASQ